jgi:eukaryotic-like serine/threonine-protein kinase
MKECPTCRCCFPDDVLHCPDDGSETSTSISGEPILDGRYQLEKRLGQGGMGVVYKARHIFLKTAHAIKIILPDLVGNDPNLVTRFRQEALAAAAIRHQNIIAVTDFGVVKGTMPFLVMEFVQGKSLQDVMSEDGAMSPARAFELMQPICAGIAAAHRQGIVHRDLKPLNVMIQDNMPVAQAVKILDFGLAKIKSGELLGSFIAAQTTGLMGSPFYMAPEQWSDEPPDARADIYSLGVMLFQMLCGEVPFKGSSIPSIMKKHLTADVPTLSSKGAEVPPQIESVVRHALEKEPNYRTASAEEFAEELSAAMEQASAQLKRTADSSPSFDSAKTIVAPPAPDTFPPAGSITASDPLAGTISAASLDEEENKTLFAQRELAKEAAAKQKFAAEEEARRKAADQKQQAESDAARDKERKQLEEIVAAQTKVLEEKLTLLASTMTPKPVDPEATHMQRAGVTTGDVSFPGTSAHAFPRVDVGPTPKRRLVLPIVLAVVLIVLIGGGIGGYLIWKSKRAITGPTGPNDPTEVPIKPNLVAIKGGKFQMGRSDGPPSEVPAHAISVSDFEMDKTEVTNAEYGQFVKQTNHAPPEQWGSIKPPAGEDLLPVSNITYEDVLAFTEWRSKRDKVTYRLPTEEEWEYAARNGEKDNLYPWGNTWEAGRAAIREAGVGAPQAVGTYPQGMNAWGALDLVGNVWEWTSSKATLYGGDPDNRLTQQKDWIVIRGGGYASSIKGSFPPGPVSSTLRTWVAPNFKNPFLGFRLVKATA